MSTIISILVFLIVLTVIVVIHELGHFYFAKKADILCHEFSVGMGPVIYQKQKGETVYSLRAIPFGGYVAMAGEEIIDAYIKKGQMIGLKLNDEGLINYIVLDESLERDFVGEVVDFDLMGKAMSPLFIEVKTGDEITKYEVERTAKYLFKKDKAVQISPEERLFDNKTIWERFKVIFAGPLANLILAFLLLFIIGFFIGKPNKQAIITGVESIPGLNNGDLVTHVNGGEVNSYDELTNAIRANGDNKVTFRVDGSEINVELVVVMQGLGFASTYDNDDLVIGQVFGRSKVLEAGDKIIGIFISDTAVGNLEYHEPTNWQDLISYVNIRDGEFVYIKYEREGEIYETTYDGLSHNALNKLGVNPVQYAGGFSQDRQFNLLYPFYYPFMQMGKDIKGMIYTIGLLINPNEGVGIGDLAGPIGIFSLVDATLKQGLISFISFAAFLSINIAVLNLMPIPALDGGRLVFLAIEGITKKPINKKVENIIINITFFLLLALLIVVSYNDILRLFN